MPRRDNHDIPTPIRAQPTLDRFAQLTATKITTRNRKTRKPVTLPDVLIDVDHGDCGYILGRLTRHLDIARDHPSEPDGYPTKASGADAGSGGGAGRPVDEDRVDLTSVEAAHDARQRWSDDHDMYTALAYQHVQIAVSALAAAKQVLEKLDGLTAHAEGLGLGDDRWCANHLRHGHPNEPRSPDGGQHCRWCADINRALGDYPNRTLIEHRHRYGKLTDAVIRQQFPDYRAEAKAG